MSTLTMKTDSQVKTDVLNELKWDPAVDETEVGVQVKNGIVTLTGAISTYAKKLAARNAAHRVHGVLDMVDDMAVSVPSPLQRTDQEIAAAVRTALKWDSTVPDEKIKSTVTGGTVILEGTVDKWPHRYWAEQAVQHLTGVREVQNRIVISPKVVDPAQIKRQIDETLERQAEREAKRIGVVVQDGAVTLTGVVRSWAERNDIRRVAWSTPGVRRLDDNITVDPYH